MTLGVPVYNGEPYVKDTLASLLAQDFDDIEIVISDNASTDGTEDICRSAAAGDSRIRYTRTDVNRGAAWNYNQVLALATAPYFKWAAADDLCAPDFVSRCVDLLETGGPSLVIAYPRTTLIDESGAEIGPLDDDDLALGGRCPRVASTSCCAIAWSGIRSSASCAPTRCAARARSARSRSPTLHCSRRWRCAVASSRCRTGCSSGATTRSAASPPGRASSSRWLGTTQAGRPASPCHRPGSATSCSRRCAVPP